jgi:hypothetical protein
MTLPDDKGPERPEELGETQKKKQKIFFGSAFKKDKASDQ